MSWQSIVQAVVLVVMLAVTVPLLGRYMAAVYGAREDGSAPGDRFFGPIERFIYRCAGSITSANSAGTSTRSRCSPSASCRCCFLYGLLRLQGSLLFNPTDRRAVSPMGAFNAAISFVTNTNWQWYSGEVAMSHLTQMVGLTVQNFVSAAAGMAIVIGLIRGITRTRSRTIGNFWVDLTRTVVRILLPLSLVFTVVLMSQGVVQNLRGDTVATTIDASTEVTEQRIPAGPFASQEAIKQLGTQRWRVLQRQLGAPVREPERVHQHPGDLRHPADPVRRWSSTFGRMVGDKRQAEVLIAGDGRDPRRVRRLRHVRRAERQPEAHCGSVSISRSRPRSPAATWRARRSASALPPAALFAASTTGTSNGCGQLHARLVHAARRHGADGAHDARRDLTGRRRRRP